MSANKIHIVSFDNPFPPNYGGVIDVFYRLKSLHELGIKITLHAFEYGRKPTKELNKYCEKVYYYERRTFVNPFVGSLPYIVSTRKDDTLLENLLKDHSPILFEGLHTCYFLDHPKLKNRFKMVRMHNIEHEYYAKLEEVESNYFKKYFFSKESSRLKIYENNLKHADLILAISHNDEKYLNKHFKHIKYIAAFHPNEKVTAISGTGDYCFYHGKLSVGENDEAARFLVEKVFNDISVPLFIAGDKPSTTLKKLIEGKPHIKLFEHISTEQINELIQKAQVNILPTFQNTGIKLKLINVLFQGRFVIANDMMVRNTGLENLCIKANSPDEFKQKINEMMKKTFEEKEIQKREEILASNFNNSVNANSLMSLFVK
jgi:glycosyltransferase involved in cell wall biosynthesis